MEVGALESGTRTLEPTVLALQNLLLHLTSNVKGIPWKQLCADDWTQRADATVRRLVRVLGRVVQFVDSSKSAPHDFEDDYDAEYRYDRSPVGAAQGLAPGVSFHVLQRQPTHVIEIGHTTVAVERRVAETIFVTQ